MPQNVPRGTHVVLLKDIVFQGNIIPQDSVAVVDQDGSLKGETIHAVFPDGRKMFLAPNMYGIRRTIKAATVEDNVDYLQYLVYKCAIGSRAYGLHNEDSDFDVRGVYLPPADLHWSLFGVPESIEHKEPDEVFWEFGRFMHLAMKANPSIIECLWTSIITVQDDRFTELLDNKRAFLSKLVYQTYNGYAISQFKKIEDDIRLHGDVRWKHASHLIRLLLNGTELMRTGEVSLIVDRYRDDLLAIRHGEMDWLDVFRWRNKLHAEFEIALGDTKLPERPDYTRLNSVLINARHSMVISQ